MPTFTPNINLKKPLQTENYNIDDFNGNCDLIDAKIGSMVANKSDNAWKPLTLFNVGDVCYSSRKIDSYKLMECTVSGNTGLVEPTWGNIGTTVTDGIVTFKVFDIRQGLQINKVLTVVDVGSGVVGLPAISGKLLTDIPFPDISGKVNLSDFTGLNQSKVANGWQKLPGGLILQWGLVASGSGGNSNIVFPIAFPTNVLRVYATASLGNYVIGLGNALANGVAIQVTLGSNGVGTSGVNIAYFTIGY